MTKIFVVWLAATGALASAASFEGVTKFESVHLSGRLTVTCHEGPEYGTQIYTCYETVLNPFEMGYFNGEKDDQANQLYLKAEQASGAVVEKTQAYDGAKGQTSRRVNLWINTLFQTGLLDLGENKVSYEIRKGSETRFTGEFKVQVDEGTPIECPNGHEFSNQMSDCRTGEFICGRYLRRCQL